MVLANSLNANAAPTAEIGRRRIYAGLAASLSCLIGLTVLLGWAIDVPVMRSVVPGAVEMKANTAIGLLLMSAAVFVATASHASSRHPVIDVLAAAAMLLGVLTLAEHGLGVNLLIDELVVRDTGAAYNASKGRMSPYSALVFTLLGLAMLALRRTSAAAQGVVRVAAGLAVAIGMVSLVGYLWNASEIITDQIAAPVAINSALAFASLGSAIYLLAGPRGIALGGASRLETLVLGGFVPTLLFVVVGGGLTYASGSNFAEASRRVAHTQGVRAEIGQLYAAIADAELARRNFVLVGDPALEQASRSSAAAARMHVATIGALVADNPEQTRLHDELGRLVSMHLDSLDALSRVKQEQGDPKALEALAVTARGNAMSGIRELSRQMDNAEATLLSARLRQTDQKRRVTLLLLLATLVTLSTLFLVLFRRIQREIRARNDAQTELTRLNEDLERRIEERTRDVGFQQAFLRRVIDLQADYVYAKDRTGRFVLANRSLADALGTTVEDLVDRREVDVAPQAQEAKGFKTTDLEVIDSGRELFVPEEQLTLADGRVRWLSTLKRPIQAATGETIVLGVSTDITERKAAESEVRQLATDLERRVAERTADLHETNAQLEQARLESETASRAKSAFLANMSHEIRTPMNAIIGLTHLMTVDAVDPSQRTRLGKVGEAARHLLQVINDILDMSKIEAGKLTLRRSEFELDALLSGAVGMVAERAREKRLEILIDADSVPERLVGDAMRISQILINLLSNAVKFTGHGWVRVRLSKLSDDADGLVVRFEVQDTGPGISADRQARLFSSFEQADNSATRQHGGTGLGLALSRQLAIAMGGDAGMESAPGSGSTFWFTARLEHATHLQHETSPVVFTGLRALLVDDLPEALEAIRHVLLMLGFSVDAVDGGRAAVERVRSELAAGRRHDLFVIDWRMEPLDGAQTLVQLRELLGGSAPPSILVTAHDDASIEEHARQARFDAVLSKPITGSSIHDPLARLLRTVSRARSRAPAALPTAQARLRTHHRGQRVLLAEDNEVNLEVAHDLLTSVGLVVDVARDGARAVAMALSTGYDVVLMDMQMPVMDGLEATRAIRARADLHVPIIAMTANAFVEDRDACLAAGMDDHVTKPVDPKVLYAALMRWLPERTPDPEGIAEFVPATAPAQASAEESSLAARLATVDGLDVQVAQRLVAGHLPVLARVLGRFVETYRAGAPELLDGRGSHEEMLKRWQRCCHSIRGALATIGAESLLEELTIMERSLEDASTTSGLISTDDLRDMGRHIHEDLQSLVHAMAAALEG